MDFYVQMHLHTSETSRCGVDSARDMIRACKRAGRLVDQLAPGLCRDPPPCAMP
jgi:hypothetical protein